MLGPNPFLNPGAEVEAEVARIVDAMASVSGLLPASLQADPDSYYAQGEGLGAEQTQQRLLERTGHVAVLARAFGWHGVALTPLLVEQMHEAIFEPVFGDRALGYRTPPARGDHRIDDGVAYPIWVADSNRAPRIVPRRGGPSRSRSGGE